MSDEIRNDAADAARFRWLLSQAPAQLAAIAYRVPAATAHADAVAAIDAAMRGEVVR